MATPVLDVGFLKFFLPVLSFIFIYVIVFAVLEKTKVLGDKTGYSAILAFIAALLFVITPGAMAIVNYMVPWLIVLFFFLTFVIVIFMFGGVSSEDISRVMGGSGVVSTILVIVVILFIIAFSSVYGESIRQITVEGNTSGSSGLGVSVGKILFNPKILGAAFVLLVASQLIRLIAISPKK